MTTIIIAEAGVNHNGSVKLAKQMIEEAAKAGADYIKFQTFKPESWFLNMRRKQISEENDRQSGISATDVGKLALSYDDLWN